MTNLVVITFPADESAIDAFQKLSDLESAGAITIYERIMAARDIHGNASVLETQTSDGLRALAGMTLGTIVGAFAGPVGLLIGLFSGTFVGAALESDYFDFTEDFKKKTIDKLPPGSVVIIAEIYEEDPSILDGALEGFGATITRSNVDYKHDEYVDSQVQEIEDQISGEMKKLKSAAEADKEKVRQRISHLKEQRKERINALKQKRQTIIAKIRTLSESRERSRIVKAISKQEKEIGEHEEKIGELKTKLTKIDHSQH